MSNNPEELEKKRQRQEESNKADSHMTRSFKKQMPTYAHEEPEVKISSASSASSAAPTLPIQQRLHSPLTGVTTTTSASNVDYVIIENEKKVKRNNNQIIQGIQRKPTSGVEYTLKKEGNEFEASLKKIPKDTSQLAHTIMAMIDDIIANTGTNELIIDTKDPLTKQICRLYAEALNIKYSPQMVETATDASFNLGIINNHADAIKQQGWFRRAYPAATPTSSPAPSLRI